MLNSVEKRLRHNQSPLAQWIRRAVGLPEASVKLRLQGNNLHVLCEGNPCPERAIAFKHLVGALKKTDVNTLTPAHQPKVYQVFLYGRELGQRRPAWTAPIYLNQLDRHLDQIRHSQMVAPERVSSPEFSASAVVTASTMASGPKPSQSSPSRGQGRGQSSLLLSNRSLAQRGQPEAIARYLSETLSSLGVAVRVSAKTVPYSAPSVVSSPAEGEVAVHEPSIATQRLWITCEAAYSPEPLLVGEPIAKKLRELKLEGFQDAIISIEVQGETKPDWLLRVDLTPPEEILRGLARWGDVEAITRLLTPALMSLGVELTTTALQESTLHLSCCADSSSEVRPAEIPDQSAVRTAIATVLESLGPQGIHAATIYGQSPEQESPVWVDWLNLPAAEHPALAESALRLAQHGDWEAIAFLLNRLLNPDLDQRLATGGVRIQLLCKQDLLHVMSDAPICPQQRHVGPAVAKFLRQLHIAHLKGVRVYGRRAGQKRPLWSYGVDFSARSRLVPEATPEFAATDAYIGDLISRPGEIVLRSEVSPEGLQGFWPTLRDRLTHGVQRSLLRSQVFIPLSTSQDLAREPRPQEAQLTKLAWIWGAVGLLLMVQADWFLGRLIQPASEAPASALEAPAISATMSDPTAEASSETVPEASLEASPEVSPEAEDSPFSNLSLSQSPETDPGIFDVSGFTNSGDGGEDVLDSNSSTAADLPYTEGETMVGSAVEPILAEDSPYPTFNSWQLDQKIALYYEQLAQSGTPDVLVVGSSRALRGVDPAALQQSLEALGYSDVTIFNFGVNGATAQVVNLILQQVLTPEQLPRLILWADGARAFNSGREDITYNGIVASDGYQQLAQGTLPNLAPSPPPPVEGVGTASNPETAAASGGIGASLNASYRSMDEWLSDRLGQVSSVHQERDRLKEWVWQRLATVVPQSDAEGDRTRQPSSEEAQIEAAALPMTDENMVDFDGFLSLAVRFNPGTYYQKYARVAGSYDSDYEGFRLQGQQDQAFQSLVQFTQAEGIPLVFVNLPLTTEYLDPVRMAHEQEFRQYMLNAAMNHEGFIFRDLGMLWPSEFDYFSDPSHLNRYGAYEVSNRLAQDPLMPWSQVKPGTSSSNQPPESRVP